MTTKMIETPQYLETAEDRDERSLQRIHAFVEALSIGYQQGKLSRQKIREVYQRFGENFLNNTLQGHGWRKPFGYAGDFMMIDKIYTRYMSDKPQFRLWDEYFHRQAAPKAVRNRKTYFKKLVRNTLRAKKTVSLLNVGSGPARDLAELYTSLPKPQRLHTTCVEMDRHAIAYAQELNRSYLPFIHFEQKNILRFKGVQTFHLIWSAGLFDYFNDKTFVYLLRRFKHRLKPNGEIVIGNFNEDHNPSRNYMEVFGQWFLHHRSESQLVALARMAGFEDRQISVSRESENVNLFLHIKAD